MSGPAEDTYSETINRAAMMLLAMSFKPALKSSLINEVIAAIQLRGGRIDDRWVIEFYLRDVFDEIVVRAMAILSVALRERLPGIADEMDEAFSDKLRALLASFAHELPTAGLKNETQWLG